MPGDKKAIRIGMLDEFDREPSRDGGETLEVPADLGKRVDLAEQSVRRGEGDPGLGDALKKDAESKWE